MRNHSRLVGVSGLVFAMVALAGGCGGSDDEAEGSNGGAGSATGSVVQNEDDGGEESGTDLPDSFPDDIPLPASYRVHSVQDTDGRLLLRVLASEESSALVSQLSDGLVAGGYTVDDPRGSGSTKAVDAEGHDRSVHISLSSTGNSTLVSYTVMSG